MNTPNIRYDGYQPDLMGGGQHIFTIPGDGNPKTWPSFQIDGEPDQMPDEATILAHAAKCTDYEKCPRCGQPLTAA